MLGLFPGVCLCFWLWLSRITTSRKTTDQSFKKISPEMYLWTVKSPLNFGSHPDSDSRSPDSGFGPNPPWRRSALSTPSALVFLCCDTLVDFERVFAT